MSSSWRQLFLLAAVVATGGCIKLTTENEIKPIEVKPIHITVDVNVKIDRALDDFFGDLDAADLQNHQE